MHRSLGLPACVLVLVLVSPPLSAALQEAETMMVVLKGEDAVGFYDPNSGKALTRVEVGDKPHEVALSEDGKSAYVTLYGVDRYTETDLGGRAIAIVDLVARRKAGEIDLGHFRRPHGIARGRSGRLYVTCDFPPSLLVVDPESRRVLKNVGVGQVLPHMVAVAADERKAYTSNSGSGTVSVIDLEAGKSVKSIEIGGVPMGLALSDDGRRLYASNRSGDAVVAIDTAKDEVVGRADVPGNPARICLLPGGDRMLVSLIEAGAVAVLDVDSLRETHRFPVGRHAEGLGLDPSGRFGYVSAGDDGKVVKFSTRDWSTVLEVKAGKRPDPIVIHFCK